MSFRGRCSLARKRLRHCNYIIFGLMLAMAGMWEEMKPMLTELLGRFLSPDNAGLAMTILGLLVILIRAIAAMRATGGEPQPQESPTEEQQ